MPIQHLRAVEKPDSAYDGAVQRRTIGQNIRRLREAAGFSGKGSQGAFAREIGISQSQLSDWENSWSKTPDVPNLLKVATALSVPVDALLDGYDATYDAAVKKRGSGAVIVPVRQGPALGDLSPDALQVARMWQGLPGDRRAQVRDLIIAGGYVSDALAIGSRVLALPDHHRDQLDGVIAEYERSPRVQHTPVKKRRAARR